MRILIALLLALFVLACAGCTPRFAYVVGSGDNTVSVYAIDGAYGQLRPLSYVSTGPNPRAITFSSDLKFAYVANAGTTGASGSVSGYAVDGTSGTLTPLDAAPLVPGHQDTIAGAGPRALVTAGGFLYVANFGFFTGGMGSVSAYAVNAATGELTPIPGVFSAGVNPIGTVTSGRFLYVLNEGGAGLSGRFPSLSAYAIDTATGALTPIDADSSTPAIEAYATGTTPAGISTSNTGRFIHVSNASTDTILGYEVDSVTGRLSRVDADPTVTGIQDSPAGKSPGALTFASGFGHSTNFAGGGASGWLSTYQVGASGSLTRIDADPSTPPVDDHLVGEAPAGVSIAVNTGFCGFILVCSRNAFVYVANSASNEISAFEVRNSTIGALAPAQPSSALVSRGNPVAIAALNGQSAAHVESKRAFVANLGTGGGGTVWSYDVIAATGMITPVSLSNIDQHPGGAGEPASVATTPDGRFVYAGRTLTSAVSGYAVDANTGTLTIVPCSPFDTGQRANALRLPMQVVVEPSGRFVYLADRAGLHGFTIDRVTGALTRMTGSPFENGLSAPIALDPGGRLLFSGPYRRVFFIDSATGALSPGPKMATIGTILGIAVHPTGRYLYVSGSVENRPGLTVYGIAAFTIDPHTAALTPIDANPTTPGLDTFGPYRYIGEITIDSRGRFLYLAGSTFGIHAFRIDAGSGALIDIDADPSTPIQDPFPAHSPGTLTIDAEDRYLYLASSAPLGGLWLHEIDANTGALTQLDGNPFTIEMSVQSGIAPAGMTFSSVVK